MKTINKIALILVLLLSLYPDLFAQNNSPTFSGTFKYDKKSTPDSIRIWTYPNDNFWDNSVDFVVRINKDKKFDFTLPPMIKPSMFGIRLVNAGTNTLIGNYYVEPNDNIHIEIFETAILEKDSVVFSGKGAAKYNVATRQYKE